MNQLIIVNVDRPRRTREVKVPGVPSLNNPSWSPDGSYIVFNGLVDGRHDLFKYELETKKVTALTSDRYSYLHPSWSPDGNWLTFSTDRPQSSQGDNPNFLFNLAVMDMRDENRTIRVFDVFPGADNINPIFDKEQQGIYFLSNSDGFRNLFFLDIEKEEVYRLTDYYTGISGITHLSPALTVARETGQIFYSHYQHGKYSIFSADEDDFDWVQVDPLKVDLTASVLPPLERPTRPIVDANLEIEPVDPIFPVDSFAEIPYKPQFSLTFIGSSGVGMATNRFGTGVAGGVSMLFSDITGDNQLFAAAAVNGEIYDFGAQVGYLNQKRRVNWGGMVSHIPYPFARLRLTRDTLNIDGEPAIVDNMQLLMQRTFEDRISAFAFFPFSTTRRLEFGASLAFYYFRIDAINNYYYQGFKIGEDRERLDAPSGFNLQQISTAYVGDNSFFGLASPMVGQRYRLGVDKYFGQVDMWNVTADYRRYWRAQPFTFAIRGVHYGRYGKEADNNLFYPLYLGYPGWVRGYDYRSFQSLDDAVDEQFTFDQLLGSRAILGGVEIRIPFSGPERLALISSNFFFTELALFLDAGVAWNDDTRITLDRSKAMDEGNRFPVFSTGPSLRINVFGALILEPYYAFPFHTKGISKGVWGLNFVPGW